VGLVVDAREVWDVSLGATSFVAFVMHLSFRSSTTLDVFTETIATTSCARTSPFKPSSFYLYSNIIRHKLEYSTMTSSDLDVLLDMGFDKERATIAVKKSGGCKLNLPVIVSSFGDFES
jgi:hypothetical protein